MAAPLRRSLPSLGRALLTPAPVRMLSAEASDALVEIKPGEIGMVSGIPEEHLRRKVVIYSPARTASQQGSGKVGGGKLTFCQPKSNNGWRKHYFSGGGIEVPCFWFPTAHNLMLTIMDMCFFTHGNSIMEWENPLMGWTSTGDPYANVGEAGLTFDSRESAKAFAEKHGWNYVVRKRHTPLLKPKAYAENFKWRGPPKPEQA